MMIDADAYKKFTASATDMTMKVVKGQADFLEMIASSTKGTPVAPLFALASQMQQSALKGFETLGAQTTNAESTKAKPAAKPSPEKAMKSAAKVMKDAVNAQADLLVTAGAEVTAATGEAKAAVTKAAKSASKGDMQKLYDDLTAVTGIGPSTMKKLHAAGVRTVDDLAKTSKSDLTKIIEDANIRVLKYTPADWIADAKNLLKTAKAA